MDRMFEKWGGGEVLKKAVRGMLPKNRLRDLRLRRLKVFEGPRHPYEKNIIRFAGVPHLGGQVQESKILEEVMRITPQPVVT